MNTEINNFSNEAQFNHFSITPDVADSETLFAVEGQENIEDVPSTQLLENQIIHCRDLMSELARSRLSRNDLGSFDMKLSDFNKQCLKMFSYAQGLDSYTHAKESEYRKHTFKQFLKIVEHYCHQLPNGHAYAERTIAGILAESAVSETLIKDCLIETHLTSVELDTRKAKIDIFALPGTSEYDQLQQDSDRVWAIQVKSSKNPQMFITKFNHRQSGINAVQSYTNHENERERLKAAVDGVADFSCQYNNVDGMLIVVPNYFHNPHYYDHESGEPSMLFRDELEQQVSRLTHAQQYPIVA